MPWPGHPSGASFQGIHAGTQRTAMGAARLVVAEIRARHRARELVRQQRHQRNHIGLLHHLRVLRALATEVTTSIGTLRSASIDRSIASSAWKPANSSYRPVAGSRPVTMRATA